MGILQVCVSGGSAVCSYKISASISNGKCCELAFHTHTLTAIDNS